MKYVMKGGDYISSFSDEYLQAQAKSRETKSGIIGQLILAEGGLTAEIIRHHPELLVKDIPKIQRNIQVYQELDALE